MGGTEEGGVKKEEKGNKYGKYRTLLKKHLWFGKTLANLSWSFSTKGVRKGAKGPISTANDQ